MRNKYIIVFSFLLFSIFCNSQNFCKNEINMYKVAFEYIKNDSVNINKSIYIADSIVFMNIDSFWDKIAEYPQKNSFKYALIVSDSLKVLDKEREFITFYSKQMYKAFRKHKKGEYNLFFSKIFDNTLVAEIMKNNGKPHESKDEMEWFKQSYLYLFYFDNKGKIIKVYRSWRQYN